MAFQEHIVGGSVPCTASSSVTAVSYDANGNYSSGGIPFGTCVKLDTSGKMGDVVACSAAGDHAFGVACEDPAAGPSEAVKVQRLGVAKCLAAAAVSLGDLVYVADTSGRGGTAPAPGVSDKWIVGTALEAATAAGDLISVSLSVDAATNVNA